MPVPNLLSLPLSQLRRLARTSARSLHPTGTLGVLLVVTFPLTFIASDAHALDRFSATLRGGVRVTGNALGLSGGDGRNAPGVGGSLATFMGDGGTRDGAFPSGTTDDWTANASSAQLELPTGARVVYAELTWGASWAGGGATVEAHLDESVTLSTRNGDVVVAPDPSASVTLDERAADGFLVRYYVRSADVTETVQRSGSGRYTIRGVPGVQAASVEELNAGGWTLTVVYYDPLDAMRNVTVASLPTWVDESQMLDLGLSGFCAPSTGEVFGHLAMWAMEGDAHLAGDRLSIDAPAGAVPISSDANPSGNFFGAQLVARGGGRDLSGQHGARNHDPVRGENVAGGRQGWDIAQATLTSSAGHLRNGQRSARILVETDEDSLLVVGAAFEIEMQAPRLTFDAQRSIAGSAEQARVTIVNVGAAPAENVTLVIGAGFDIASATVAGRALDVAPHADGTALQIPELAPDGAVTVELEVSVRSEASPTLYATFDWTPCAGERFAGETTETVAFESLTIDEPADAGGGDTDAGIGEADARDDASDSGSDDAVAEVQPDSGANAEPDAEADGDGDAGAGADAEDVSARLDTDPNTRGDDTAGTVSSDALPTAPDRRTAPEDSDSAGGCSYASSLPQPFWLAAVLMALIRRRSTRYACA